MKNKRIILAVISIVLIAILTTVSFAANNTRTGMTFEEAVQASKERNNKVEKETTNALNENKVSNETNLNTVENEVINETNSNTVEDETNNIVEDDDESTEIEEEVVVLFKETISEDISKVDDNVEYKDINVDGNVHIIAEKVVLENVKVYGNLFIMSTNVELKNVIIEESAYIVAENVKVDGQIKFAYIVSNNVTIEASTDIAKELRVVSTNFELEGSVGRDLYVYSENLKISDRTEIYGDCIIEAATIDISEDAKINGEKKIEIVQNTNTGISINKQQVYSNIIVNCIIILIVTIFILYSSPKFVAVNGKLRLRDFIKAFFTGVLELILVFMIFIALVYIGYGIGFGFALFILSMILVYFGKMLFIISAGIRLAGKSENVSKVKSFFAILVVLVITQAISLLALTGLTGLIVSMVIDLVLGITGFGSLVRVVLTPSRKKKHPQVTQSQNTMTNVREVRPEDFVIKGVPVENQVNVAPEVKESNVQVENNEMKKETQEIKTEEVKEEKIEQIVELEQKENEDK